MKPYSEACERNKRPILEVLREAFAAPGLVLEIGSGTGQHAVFFAEALPHLQWQPSELPEGLAVLEQGLAGEAPPNLRAPLALDVAGNWPPQADYLYSANTAHIMGWPEVEAMFAAAGRILAPGGRFCLYGPFNYDGGYTSASNQQFDGWLRQRNPRSGIRDIEAVTAAAAAAGLSLLEDRAMPANNRCLVFESTRQREAQKL